MDYFFNSEIETGIKEAIASTLGENPRQSHDRVKSIYIPNPHAGPLTCEKHELEQAILSAQAVYNEVGPEGLVQLVANQAIRDRYKDDKKVKSYASEALPFILSCLSKEIITDAKQVIEAYSLSIDSQEEGAREGIVKQLSTGYFEFVQLIAEQFNVSIDEEIYNRADNNITTNSKDIPPKYQFRRQSFDAYRDGGLEAITIPPVLDIPTDFKGKLLMFTIDEQNYVRLGINYKNPEVPPGAMSYDRHLKIYKNFQYELQERGLNVEPIIPGGAWFETTDDGTYKIYDISLKYGECDKKIAAEVIHSKYPNKEILIQWNSNQKPDEVLYSQQ